LEGFYTALWYVGPMNHTPGLDYTASASGPLTVHYALVYIAMSAACVGITALIRSRQLQYA